MMRFAAEATAFMPESASSHFRKLRELQFSEMRLYRKT